MCSICFLFPNRSSSIENLDLPLLTYHREHVRVVDGAVLGFSVLYVLPVHCSGNSQSEVRSKHVHEHTSANVHNLSSFTSMLTKGSITIIRLQWRIQDFSDRAAKSQSGCANLLFCKLFAKNCMKMKQFGPEAHVQGAPWIRQWFVITSMVLCSGGSKSRGHQGPAPSRSKFFHFHAFFGKILENNRLAHLFRELAPPYGKSWISHCFDVVIFW